MSPWDLLEGHRNPAPLSWSWFGAIRLERTLSKYEEVFKMMRSVTERDGCRRPSRAAVWP